jgi:hypothetical protein
MTHWYSRITPEAEEDRRTARVLLVLVWASYAAFRPWVSFLVVGLFQQRLPVLKIKPRMLRAGCCSH